MERSFFHPRQNYSALLNISQVFFRVLPEGIMERVASMTINQNREPIQLQFYLDEQFLSSQLLSTNEGNLPPHFCLMSQLFCLDEVNRTSLRR